MQSDSSSPSDRKLLEKRESKKYLAYFNVAAVLISVMFFEMVLINFTEFTTMTNLLLGVVYVLLAIKFITLLIWFMHLRWENSLIWGLFLSGLILAIGTVAAVMAIMLFADNMLAP